MSKYPSKTTMIISILLIAFFSSLKYSNKLSAQHFQLKFDLKNEKLIKSYGEGSIDSISYNYLSIYGLKASSRPDNQNTFSLSHKDGNKYYFRYLYLDSEKDTLVFNAVEWITGIPEINGKASLTELDVPMKENKGDKIITIGDEILVKEEAKYYRRKIAAEIDVNFYGRQKDVFNYKHEADYTKKPSDILKEIYSIADAEIYILGWRSNNETTKELKELVEVLSKKEKTKKIVLINAPRVKNNQQNKLNIQYNQSLSFMHNNKLLILDAYSIFDGEKKEYLGSDSIQLNKYGYEKLASETVKLLK